MKGILKYIDGLWKVEYTPPLMRTIKWLDIHPEVVNWIPLKEPGVSVYNNMEVDFEIRHGYASFEDPISWDEESSEIEQEAEKAAIRAGYIQSDKEQHYTTPWTEHNIYKAGFLKGVQYQAESEKLKH